jgi:hypothetical protein
MIWRRILAALAVTAILATPCYGAAVPQTGAVTTPGGSPLQLTPGTQFRQACNGGSGGIVGQRYGGAECAADGAYIASTSVTPGSTALAVAGRTVVTTCTVAGDVVIVHADASTVTVASAVGTSYWPEQAVQIASSGTTATCSYWIEN